MRYEYVFRKEHDHYVCEANQPGGSDYRGERIAIVLCPAARRVGWVVVKHGTLNGVLAWLDWRKDYADQYLPDGYVLVTGAFDCEALQRIVNARTPFPLEVGMAVIVTPA